MMDEVSSGPASPLKKLEYKLSEKPFQLPSTLPSVKLKMNIISTGAYSIRSNAQR
jgi:hypothetical protein